MTSIENAFRPAFEEIARRGEAIRTEAPIFFEPSGTGAQHLPFRMPDQRYTLLTMGTAVLPPCPVDECRPALRVYGTFPTQEEAMEHKEVVRGVDPNCSFVVAKTNDWVLFPQTVKARDDPAEAKHRIEVRLQAHRLRQAEQGAAFEREVRERVERTGPPPAPVAEDQDEMDDAEATVYPPLRRMRAGAEVRGQAAVALCVLPDEARGECLVKILGCFESGADAQVWVQDVATRHVTEDDVLVGRTCEWLYPNGATGDAPTFYRHPELQRIMDTATSNPTKVRSYKEWKAASESEAPSDATV